jgi:hypothetical protein
MGRKTSRNNWRNKMSKERELLTRLVRSGVLEVRNESRIK